MSQLTLGKEIKCYMVLNGITQIDLSLRAGINKGSLSLFLNGRYILKDQHLRKICLALGLDFNDAKKGRLTLKARKKTTTKEEQQAFAF